MLSQNLENLGTVNLNKMRDNHHRIAQLIALGWKTEEIANDLNMNVAYVSQLRCNHPLIKRKVNELQKRTDQSVVDFKQEISDLLPKAIETFREILDDVDSYPGSLRLVAAKHVLGVNGIVPPKNVKVLSVSTAMSQEKLSELVGNLTRNAEKAGIIIPEND